MCFANSNFLKRDSVRPDGCNSLTLELVTFESPCRKKVRNSTVVLIFLNKDHVQPDGCNSFHISDTIMFEYKTIGGYQLSLFIHLMNTIFY